MSSFCFAELRKRNLIYQKIIAQVFAARGIENFNHVFSVLYQI